MSAESDFKAELDTLAETKHLLPAHLGEGKGGEEVDTAKAIAAVKSQFESLRVRLMDMSFIVKMIDEWLKDFGDGTKSLNALHREPKESFEGEQLKPELLAHVAVVKALDGKLNNGANLLRQIARLEDKKVEEGRGGNAELAAKLRETEAFATKLEQAVYNGIPSVDNIGGGHGGLGGPK